MLWIENRLFAPAFFKVSRAEYVIAVTDVRRDRFSVSPLGD